MPIYQTSKELTKFGLVGISAVCVDLFVYYLLSQFISVDISKALSFLSGTFVTYNLNKYWTWRQTDKNTTRLIWFVVLYAGSMLINVGVNSLALDYLPNTEMFISTKTDAGELVSRLAMKMDKFIAFFIATAVSSVFNFIGQKYWVFRGKVEVEED
ncbi:GtrA family protein [bacterium]|nr:GtrA family protein [bacterium]